MLSRSCLQYRIPIRGGNWNNDSNAGLFNLNLNNNRDIRNNNIGFRVALILCRNSSFKQLEVRNEQKEIKTVTKSKRQKYSRPSMRLVTDTLDNAVWEAL